MRVAIVTGAGGFVGNAVVKALASKKIKVYAVVRECSRDIDWGNDLNIITIRCDMENYSRLPEMIEEKNIDVFYHFAWSGTAGIMRGNEDKQLENVKYSCVAVKTATDMGIKKFVFASSIMEYEMELVLQSENNSSMGSIYSIAKKTANYMCRVLANNFNIEYVAGIISNIYGPGEISPRLINTTIRKLINKEETAFSPGEQLYDFIYISDAADIFVEIGEHGKNNKSYYVGNRKQRKLKEFLYEIGEVVAPNTELGIGKMDFNGISLKYKEFDVESTFGELGCVCKVDFKDGIKRTMEWIKEN